ncbi:MAG: cysteine peptidase family C39 domain-containing protein [Pseudomonadota bacterium]
MDSQATISTQIDTGIICLALIAQYLRLPADPDGIRHDLGLVAGVARSDDVIRAAKRLKLKARRIAPSARRLEKLPLPAIFERPDGSFAISVTVHSFAMRAASILPAHGWPNECTVTEIQVERGEARRTGRVATSTRWWRS